MDRELLPISLIAELEFCPRNFYYRACERIDSSNEFVTEGKIQEERRNQRESVTRENSVQTREIHLSSDSLGITGVLDCVEEGDSRYPVEFKRGTIGDNRNHEVQLCLQAVLMEENLNIKVDYGYIYYSSSKKRKKVLFTRDLREHCLGLIETARDLLYSGEIPPPVADKRCRGCSLFDVCLPFEVAYINDHRKTVKRIVPGVNDGRTLYVDEHGAYIRKKGNRIVVTKQEDVLAEIPAFHLNEVVIASNANFSIQALRYMMYMNVSISVLTTNGRYQGRFVHHQSKNTVLKKAQFASLANARFIHEISSAFITAKLQNMRTVLMRYNRGVGDRDLDKASRFINREIKKLAHIVSAEQLRGIEGICSKEYFSQFNLMIKNSSYVFHFEKRTRRPPKDRVNALLGFGYSVLLNDIVSALNLAGLDPYIGFYHSEKYGRPSLALDLMEEFRHAMVDTLVISLINRNIIKLRHFEEKYGGVYLNEKGRKVFFESYIKKRSTEVIHPLFKYSVSYTRVYQIQARLIAKVLTGEIERYIPFVTR